MTPAAKSVYYFGFYLYLVGATLIFIPNFLLKTMGIPETNEVWIRVVGFACNINWVLLSSGGSKKYQCLYSADHSNKDDCICYFSGICFIANGESDAGRIRGYRPGGMRSGHSWH